MTLRHISTEQPLSVTKFSYWKDPHTHTHKKNRLNSKTLVNNSGLMDLFLVVYWVVGEAALFIKHWELDVKSKNKHKKHLFAITYAASCPPCTGDLEIVPCPRSWAIFQSLKSTLRRWGQRRLQQELRAEKSKVQPFFNVFFFWHSLRNEAEMCFLTMKTPTSCLLRCSHAEEQNWTG